MKRWGMGGAEPGGREEEGEGSGRLGDSVA